MQLISFWGGDLWCMLDHHQLLQKAIDCFGRLLYGMSYFPLLLLNVFDSLCLPKCLMTLHFLINFTFVVLNFFTSCAGVSNIWCTCIFLSLVFIDSEFGSWIFDFFVLYMVVFGQVWSCFSFDWHTSITSSNLANNMLSLSSCLVICF